MSPAQVASVVSTFSSDRRFQLWSYRVSHSQLLLRSVRDAEHTSRIDVLFKGVDALGALEQRVRSDLEQYTQFARRLGQYAHSRYALGTDLVQELERGCRKKCFGKREHKST